jgi:peptidoglycan/LPS O-acetylase OafA/YrhL
MMLFGFLLPLLRRLSARARLLIAAAVAVGVALALALVLAGHGHHREYALPIRFCLLLVLAGLGLLVSGVYASRRDHQHHATGAEQADDQS